MAKLTSNEFNNKYKEKIVDNDDLLVELMEDFADSIPEGNSELEDLKKELEEIKTQLEESKRKYKERFFEAVKDESNEENSDMEKIEDEEKIIDIKEV